jgi:preprotein translocase subunit SecG
MRLQRLTWILSVVVAAACLALAVYYRHVSAVTMYDSNFEAFHQVLSANQR